MSICDNCIHNNVCSDEGHLDEALTFCADKEEKRSAGEWVRGREICREMIGNIEHIEYKDYTCSNCGLVLDNLLYHVDGSPFYKFCPNCGADMRGGNK